MKQPEMVYRYQKFDALSLSALVFDQLFFSGPESFNDPLDCRPCVISDSSLNELRTILKAQITARLKDENFTSLEKAKVLGDEAKAHAMKTAEFTAHSILYDIAYSSTNPDLNVTPEEAEAVYLKFEIQKELLLKFDRGICCFSSENNNPLLWSHYADQHKGVCAGYSLDRTPKPKLFEVSYGGGREVLSSSIKKAVIDNNTTFQDKLDNDILLRKALPWSYEKEWRLLGSRGLQDSPLSLEEITFGLRCPAAVRHAVVSALLGRAKLIKFYEINIQNDSFELIRSPLDIEGIEFLPRVSYSGKEIFGDIEK